MKRLLPIFAALAVAILPGGIATASAQTTVPLAKRLPPAGLAISKAERDELTTGAAALRREIDTLTRDLASTPTLFSYLPDIEIFHKAVDWALRYDEFFAATEVTTARELLAQGRRRAAQLRRGRMPWLDVTGLVVRGYRSKLDDSIQPYGLLVPANWKRDEPSRLQVWLLGRGEKRSELAFLADRLAKTPELTPKDTIILIPYGRYCNATKFAGEVDVFEAMDAVRGQTVIDPLRTSVAGFSMGGASVWHLATHHAGRWSSASPGAGFAETPIYTKAFAPGKEPPTWWEQKLWGWYDATLYAGNLFNSPTIAYNGEIDPQKQSSEVMEKAMATEGLKLERLIGPQTAHKYHPTTKDQLTARLEALADKGGNPLPREVRVSTYTLRYTGDTWFDIRGLEHHWARADVHARLIEGGPLTIETRNVTALQVPPWAKQAEIDGHKLALPAGNAADTIWLRKEKTGWRVAEPWTGLHKDRGLTGPIDDAFMEAFVFVKPTGPALNEKLGSWTAGELAHAQKMWRDIFRGDAPVQDDTAVNDDDIAKRNLILWGDPSSNRVLAKILAQLPLSWDAQQLVFRGQTYAAADHAPILIFPNPLNPRRYVVLNSGIDFRDHAYGTNALQIAKLPDYAIIDLREAPGPRWPGKIVDAGFFDEEWK
ncbi:MAG: hypothetical protein EXS43_06195 [Opitutus sp.]|nr:hypothetical protein [Opitutus sp.]